VLYGYGLDNKLGRTIILSNIQVPGSELEPEQEQTFTRREKKLYAKAVGQRTATKRPIKKRKARSLGKADAPKTKTRSSSKRS
jgi:hypothetical protein